MRKKTIVFLLLLILIVTLCGCGGGIKGRNNNNANAAGNNINNNQEDIKATFINVPESLQAAYGTEFELPQVKAEDEDGNEYPVTVKVKDNMQAEIELINNRFTITDQHEYTVTYSVEIEGRILTSARVPIAVSHEPYNKNSKLQPIEYDKSLVYDIMIWDAPTNRKKTQEGLNEVAEAGYNIIIPGLHTMDFGTSVDNALKILDRAHAAGLKVFIIDSNILVYIAQWNSAGSSQPETINTTNIQYYKDHPAFLGLNVSDEPYYRDFNLLAKKVAQIKEVFPDKMVFINIWPRAAGSGNYGTTYETYLQDMMEKVGPSILSYDHYPFDTKRGFWPDWFFCLEEIKYKAMEYNVPANMVMQVDGSANYDKRYCTLEEIRWQMAVIMTFGYEYITHYSYTPLDDTHFRVIKNGQKTQLYYDIQVANLELRKWDHVYKSFVHNYQGTAVVRNNRRVFDTRLEYFMYPLSIDDIPEIKSVDSSEYLLIGYFKDNNDNAGFMVTNVSLPGENRNAMVTMEFDEKYLGLQIYDKGEMDIIRLKDNKITFEIESSYGVFIIPLMAQEDSEDIKEDVTVSFDLNYVGSTAPENIKVKPGQPYGKLPTPPEREGYTFLRWRDGRSRFANDITADTVVEINEDHTLYAIWQGNPVTVSFNLNGGTYYGLETIDARTVSVGEMYTTLVIPPAVEIQKNGYVFKGWYLNEDFSGPMIEPNSTVSVTTDHTLYAKWEKMKDYYDFENEDGIYNVNDVLGNLAPSAISIVERGEPGNHMLKIDTKGAKLLNAELSVVSVTFEGLYIKPGQYLSFDIQSHAGTYDAIQLFDAADNELGAKSNWTGKHYLHTVSPTLKTIVIQPKVESTYFRLDLWGSFGWIFYIDNIRITDTDPRK